MIENESLDLNIPSNMINYTTDKKINPFNIQNTFKSGDISSNSTEINSNKTMELKENFSPKKNNQKPSKSEVIKTFCRIRPINGTNELFSISPKDERILNINSVNLEKLNVGNNLKLINSYTFSKVFGENSSQEEVFEYTCQPLIDDLIINHKSGLVFTYGMTNAGKTFTVIGTPEKPGILPQALKKLLEYKEGNNSSVNRYKNFYCNFVEIYNEDIFDLLADDPTGKNKYFKRKLNIKENLNSVFFLQDVTFAKLDSIENFNNILNKGISKKVHSSTVLNQNSSRSHTIFKIVLFNNNKNISKIDFSIEELVSLSVVDLAGSERQKRTDAKGINLQEACKINQSLSTLGKCLEAMKHNSISNAKKIVPLRESKLTKIFAEYFQGNQNIIMITNINPRTEDFEETIRALNYSCVARDIKPVKSMIPKLNTGNELKIQLKKEKKLTENNTNNVNNIIESEGKEIQIEKSAIPEVNTADKLNDSFTLNLNDIFNESAIKTEFTHPPEENSSTKDEIAKLMLEIKKLREEVNEFKTDKSDNSELKNQIHPGKKTEALLDSKKNCSLEKNRPDSQNNNNINPFGNDLINENNNNQNESIHELNNSSNCNESFFSQRNNFNNESTGLIPGPNNFYQNKNMNPMGYINNMMNPYGSFGFPYNNPFIPFYGPNMCGQSMYNSPFLALPDAKDHSRTQNIVVKNGRGKKNAKKSSNINGILNSALNNIFPGMPNRLNLIFINSKFGNLVSDQSIEEENDDFSDSDDKDSVPKKRKAKGTPKKKKKKYNKKNVQKYFEKQKKPFIYPKNNRYNKNNNHANENYVIDENNNESNYDEDSMY